MDMSHSPFSANKNGRMESAPVNAAVMNNAPNDQGEGGADIGYYVRLLMLYKWRILAFVFVITALAVMFVKPLRAEFRATTKILIETSRNNVVELQEVYGANTQNREYLTTQYEIIRTRALVERVVDRLELTRHPEFDPRQMEYEPGILATTLEKLGIVEPATEPVYDDAFEYGLRREIVGAVQEGLAVEPLFGTHLVNISFLSNDPDLAADVANTVADVYIESYLESKLEVTKRATSWLSERLGELRENLQTSEERLQDYREQERLVDVGGVRTLDSAELSRLREDLVSARQDRADAESLYSQVRDISSLSTERLLAIPTILNNRVVQRLVEAKSRADRQVEELSSTYGAKHPRMQAAIAEQSSIGRELNDGLQAVAQGIVSSYQSAQRREQDLRRQIANVQGRLQNVSRKEVRLRELEREVETNRQLYDLFLSRGREVDETSRIEDIPARVIDVAIAPTIPVGPNKKKYVIAAFMFSVSVCVGLIILLDLLDSSIRTPEDIESKLKVPLLGFLPVNKNNKSDVAFRVFSAQQDEVGFTEAVRTIRTNIVLSSLDSPSKVILISSAVPDEGKSTVSINLAEALGKMEKVLLIGADLRKPSMAKALGLPQSSIGLSNILSGKAKLEDCVHKLPDSEIDVLLSGYIPENPLELLGSKQFKEVLNTLKAKYDRIVIDSAPVHVVSDAQVISTYADEIVYVVKANSTPVSIASKGLKMLRSVNAPVSGVVLNYVDLEKYGQYSEFYGVYKQYYGYGSDAKEAS